MCEDTLHKVSLSTESFGIVKAHRRSSWVDEIKNVLFVEHNAKSLQNPEEFEIEYLELKLIFLLLLSVHEGKKNMKNKWNV